jgi:DNA-binding NtrC family response regulator
VEKADRYLVEKAIRALSRVSDRSELTISDLKALRSCALEGGFDQSVDDVCTRIIHRLFSDMNRVRATEPAAANGDEIKVAPPIFDRTLADVERAYIQLVYEETNRNITKSARILAIDRSTLYNKLKKYALK